MTPLRMHVSMIKRFVVGFGVRRYRRPNGIYGPFSAESRQALSVAIPGIVLVMVGIYLQLEPNKSIDRDGQGTNGKRRRYAGANRQISRQSTGEKDLTSTR